MEKIIKKYFKSKNIAVVGASSDKNKYGYKVFKMLINLGYNVFPINPKLKELDGIKVFKKISDIEENIDAVSFIIPPEQAESVLEEVNKKGIRIVWFQPGAES